MSYFGIPIRNGLPIGLGSVAPLASGGGSPFSPLSLFSGGAPGAWYDPSDLTTLFQDSAGTTPVTAVEQPVGLMLDKSQGLVLGSELVTNGTFVTDTAWTKEAGWSITGGKAVFNGTANKGLVQNIGLTANVVGRVTIVVDSVTSGGVTIQFGFNTGVATITSPGTYTYTLSAGAFPSIYIVSVGTSQFAISSVSVKAVAGNHAFQSTSASRPVLSARINKLLATATLATQSVTTRATAHTLRFEGAGSVTLTGTAIGVYTAGTHSITTTAGTLTLTVLGSVTSADLRETNDGVGVPAYQAVVTSTNYATTGFLPFLRFDGVDDSLSTNSISFTSTDKMSVFAGVRKLSDAGANILVELSQNVAVNNGSFYITAPESPSSYLAISHGTAGISASQSSGVTGVGAAPDTAVISGLLNIPGDSTIIRRNGTAFPAGTGDQGAGNYGNYPLFICRRNNASNAFNGQLYSMIIVGKAVTAGELSSTETYVNQKTGAY